MNNIRVRSIDVLQEDAFKHLTEDGMIDCNFDEFKKATGVFQTPHGVYCELYANASEETMSSALNSLLSMTAEDLTGYESGVDLLVCRHNEVRYFDAIDTYVLFHDMDILYDM